MRFDPIARRLYTDDGDFLKKLSCLLDAAWSDLRAEARDSHRRCDACRRRVYETNGLSDEAISQLMEREPDACLKIDLTQPNLQLAHVPGRAEEKRKESARHRNCPKSDCDQ